MNDAEGRFHRSRPVFAFCVQGYDVVDAAPIARRRLVGKPSIQVFRELRRLGLEVEPVPG